MVILFYYLPCFAGNIHIDDSVQIEVIAQQMSRKQQEQILKELNQVFASSLDLRQSFKKVMKRKKISIELREIRSENFFFSMEPILIEGKWDWNRYLLGVHPRALLKDLDFEYRRAIWTHELYHLLSYQNWRGLWTAFWSQYIEAIQISYERRIDLQTLAADDGQFSKPLIGYRKWLYDVLPANQIAAKKKIYLSPEEIQWLGCIKNRQKKIQKWLKKRNFPDAKEILKKEIDLSCL